MTNHEHRKVMWLILSKLFSEYDSLEFIWMFSEEDMDEANMYPDGATQCSGVIKGILNDG